VSAALALAAPVMLRADQAPVSSIAGAWTLDRNDSSGQPSGERPPDEPSPGYRRGGRGRGGFGGGFGGLGGFAGSGSAGRGNAEEAARLRQAVRDLRNPPTHLVIVDAGSMIVLTGPDGRTLRLSPDGKKVKDENTGIERKTKWTDGKLVSEISGLGPRIVETYSVEGNQLRIESVVDSSGRSSTPATFTHLYNPDPPPVDPR
jgi:hypothetical protein